jgi:hypothetical protein
VVVVYGTERLDDVVVVTTEVLKVDDVVAG